MVGGSVRCDAVASAFAYARREFPLWDVVELRALRGFGAAVLLRSPFDGEEQWVAGDPWGHVALSPSFDAVAGTFVGEGPVREWARVGVL